MPPPRSEFRERLGIYLLGVAIGLCILGVLYMAKQQAARRQTPAPPPAAPQR